MVGALHLALAKALQAEGRIVESVHELEVGLAQSGHSTTIRVRLLAELTGRRLHCRDAFGELNRPVWHLVAYVLDDVRPPIVPVTCFSSLRRR